MMPKGIYLYIYITDMNVSDLRCDITVEAHATQVVRHFYYYFTLAVPMREC